MNLYYKNNRKRYNNRAVVWESTRRFYLLQGGAEGGAGGTGATTSATTRVSVVDPHIVLMWRDVMHTTDQAYRLNVCAGAGGGGGGGEAATGAVTGSAGFDGFDGTDVSNCVLTVDS